MIRLYSLLHQKKLFSGIYCFTLGDSGVTTEDRSKLPFE